jgi:hypothetical protein
LAAGPGLVAKTQVVFCPGFWACAIAVDTEKEAAKVTMTTKLITISQIFFSFISLHLLMDVFMTLIVACVLLIRSSKVEGA